MTVYPITSGTDNITLHNTGDSAAGAIQFLSPVDTITGLAAGTFISFTNTGVVITANKFNGVNGVDAVKLGNGTNTIHINNHMASQAFTTNGFTVDATASTGASDFIIDSLLSGTAGPDLTHMVTIKGGTGSTVLETDIASLSEITFVGQGTHNTLQLDGGGDANLSQSSTQLSDITAYNLTGTAAYSLTLGNTGGTVYMGTNADTTVYGGTAATQFNLGAAGQSAFGGTGNDMFQVNENTYEGSTIDGGGGFLNTLVLAPVAGTPVGGFAGDFYLNDMSLNGIQQIQVGNYSTNVAVDNFTLNELSPVLALNIVLGNGNDQIDLRACVTGHVFLHAGNGNDIVWMGSMSQVATLGTGTNTVLIDSCDPAAINGGTGTTSAVQQAGNTSVNTLVVTGGEEIGPPAIVPDTPSSVNVWMYNSNAGFHAVDLGFNDTANGGDLSFFDVGQVDGDSGVNVFFWCDAGFHANNTAGLVVYGTIYGGDCISLGGASWNGLAYVGGATDQSYISGGDAGAQAGLTDGVDASSDNWVALTANGITAAANGTILNGGEDSTLEIKQGGPGAFNFTAAGVTVEGFTTVVLDYGQNVNLTLNVQTGGYGVVIEGGTITDNLIAADASDSFLFAGSTYMSGEILGKGGTITVDASSVVLGATLNLNNLPANVEETTISGISGVTIEEGSSLTLTSHQILSDGLVGEFSGDGTLVVDVSGVDLNVADLKIGPAIVGGLTTIINDNNLGDTVNVGPDNATINLGGGNDWINAGSGSDTINAAYNSGAQSVIIVGNAAGIDVVNLGTAGETMVTQDTIIGANATSTGSLTVNIVNGASLAETYVDLTGATLQNLDNLNIGAFATATLEINQLANLAAGQKGDFTITNVDSTSTIEVIADNGPTSAPSTNEITTAELSNFTGQVVIDVTAVSTASPPGPVTVLVDAGVTNDITVLANTTVGQLENITLLDSGNDTVYAGTITGNVTLGNGTDTVYVGNGVVTYTGGDSTTDTIVLNSGSTVAGDTFNGSASPGGEYIFDVNTNTNFTTVAGFNADATEVLANIASGVTATVYASVVDQLGFAVAGPGSPAADGTLDILLNQATFTQGVITVEAGDLTEIIDASGFTASGVTIDLTPTLGTPTVTEVIGSGKNDTITFNASETFSGSIDGKGGTNTITIGNNVASTSYDVDFTGATSTSVPLGIQNVQVFNIGWGDTGAFNEAQVYGSVVDDNGTFVIDVDGNSPTPHVLSLAQTNIGPIAANQSLTLNLLADVSTPAVIIHADSAGDTIEAGAGTEYIYDGAGNDTITTGSGSDTVYLVNGGNDSLYASTGSTASFVFNAGSNLPGSSWAVTSNVSESFYGPTDTINGTQYGGTAANTSITVQSNTDFTQSTIVGVGTITVDSGQAAVFTDAQLQAFAAAPAVTLTAADATANLVIDAKAASFLGTEASYDLSGWAGTLTVDGGLSTGQTINLTGFTGEVNVYGGAGNDTFNLGASVGGAGGVINGGGGINTLVVGATTDFSDGQTLSSNIVHINAIDITGSGANATFTYDQIVHDVNSLGGGALALQTAHGANNYTVTIDGSATDGNIDFSGFNMGGFSSTLPNTAALVFNENAGVTESITVYGSDNNSGSADILNVNGHGDTVWAGPGSDLINFAAFNTANDYQVRSGDLGSATDASGVSALAAEGDVVEGIKANDGYVDLQGFAGVKTLTDPNQVAPTTPGYDLGSSTNGLGKYGVVVDSDQIPTNFITGAGDNEKILGSSIASAVNELKAFTDNEVGTKGFVAIWDTHGDIALFYVDHELASLHTIQPSEIQLVGVINTNAGTTTSTVLPTSFFHIHA